MKTIPLNQMTLRDLIAAGATEKDVDEIMMENIRNLNNRKVHDRQSARWEHADRMLAIRGEQYQA